VNENQVNLLYITRDAAGKGGILVAGEHMLHHALKKVLL